MPRKITPEEYRKIFNFLKKIKNILHKSLFFTHFLNFFELIRYLY